MQIFRTQDYQAMSRKAANIISAQVIINPSSVLGLATGSTPLGIYRQLIDWYNKGDLDFSKAYSVNLDEYVGLSPDHEQSYHYYMNENFFSHVNFAEGHNYLPDGMAKDIDAECARYDKLISDLGGISLQLLGIGHTGHIGFNEPNAAFDKMTHAVDLHPKTIEANARFFASPDEVPKQAITMGIKSIMQAKQILLVANGAEKAEILYESLFGPVTPAVPASILQLHPNVTVVADEAALSVIMQHHSEAVSR